MGKYKLVALDMDGTLLDEEKNIPEENKRWIRAAGEAGVTVSLSTGRGVQNILPYIEELGLSTPVVAVNGSEVWSTPQQLYRRTLMPLETMQKLHQMAVEYKTWYWAYAVEGMFNTARWAPEMEDISWLKFGFQTENSKLLADIRQQLEQWGTLEITNSHPDNIEINPLGISKASGLREICGLLGITMDEVVAMGDSQNDLSMIREAGLGVAMGNAQDGVKAEADLVTVTNEEAGVAKVIRELVLG